MLEAAAGDLDDAGVADGARLRGLCRGPRGRRRWPQLLPRGQDLAGGVGHWAVACVRRCPRRGGVVKGAFMKAIVYREFGSADVLKVQEIEKPTPADDQVLIKVRAASVNPLDWRLMRGEPYFARLMGGLRRVKGL